MKKIIFTIYLGFFIFSFCLGQPAIEWSKCYGGSNEDYFKCLGICNDGGYILTGYTGSNDGDVSGNHGNWDYWIVKIDSAGNIQWKKCFGGSIQENANSISVSIDGTYLIAGTALSNDSDVVGNHGSFDCWILKLDTIGNIIWAKTFGGTNGDGAMSITNTLENGYIFAGQSFSNDGDVSNNQGLTDIWVVKLDTAGNIQWQKSYGGTGTEFATSIEQTTDSGYIVSGFTNSNDGDVSNNHGSFDYWILKLDTVGNIQWKKCFGGTGIDEASSILQTIDGGYIVSGYTASGDGDVIGFHGGYDAWVLKLDSVGNIIWQKSFGGTDFERSSHIIQINNGDYIVAAEAGSNDGDVIGYIGNPGFPDDWILHLDSNGNIKWQKVMGGSLGDAAIRIQNTNDGGYIVGSISGSNDSNVIGNHMLSDYWIIKLSSDTITGIEYPTKSNSEFFIFPNPANETLAVNLSKSETITIINLLGKTLTEKNFSVNSKRVVEMDVSTLPLGIYFIKAGNEVRKFVKE